MSHSACELHDRVAAGDREAVGAVLDPLLPRLVKLADRLLWGQPSGDADAQDAAQSAIRTYLRRTGEGQFKNVDHAEELFRLLATITCRKALKQVRRRGKVIDESSLQQSPAAGAARPTMAQLAPVVPEQEFDLICEEWFRLLPDDSLRSVALMTLHGYSQQEIARAHGFTPRNVRYKLDKIRRIWAKTLGVEDR
jgi:DNA-directed RNA polymerase specialized sigma24 family protein